MKLDPSATLTRVLGRNHLEIPFRGGVAIAYDMADFAKSTVALYESIAGAPVKCAQTPHLPDGACVEQTMIVRVSCHALQHDWL